MKTFSKILCVLMSLLLLAVSSITFYGLNNQKRGAIGASIKTAKEELVQLKSSMEKLNNIKETKNTVATSSLGLKKADLPNVIAKAESVFNFYSILGYLALLFAVIGIYGLVAPFIGKLEPLKLYVSLACLALGIILFILNPSQKDHIDFVSKAGYTIVIMNVVLLFLTGSGLWLSHKFNKTTNN